jgi:hypothetical protein
MRLAGLSPWRGIVDLVERGQSARKEFAIHPTLGKAVDEAEAQAGDTREVGVRIRRINQDEVMPMFDLGDRVGKPRKLGLFDLPDPPFSFPSTMRCAACALRRLSLDSASTHIAGLRTDRFLF